MRPTFLRLIKKYIVSGDKYKFRRQKSNNLICLRHIMLLHRAFINAPSKLLYIHMHFNILFAVAFVCVCADIRGDESACVLMVAQYVCALALKVSMNSLITIAPMKGNQYCRREAAASTQICLTFWTRVHFPTALQLTRNLSEKKHV